MRGFRLRSLLHLGCRLPQGNPQQQEPAAAAFPPGKRSSDSGNFPPPGEGHDRRLNDYGHRHDQDTATSAAHGRDEHAKQEQVRVQCRPPSEPGPLAFRGPGE